MKRLASHALLAVVALCGVLGSAGSAKAEYIVNGGFETGDFTGWTQSGDTSFTGISSFLANSGTFAARFGPVGGLGYIEQTFAAPAGQTLVINFDLANDGGNPNAFEVSFNGTTLYSATDLPGTNPSFTHFTFVTTADASNTLKFGFFHSPAWFTLDDVSVEGRGPVTATPAPAGVVLFAIGFVGMGAGRLVRRRKVAA